MCKATETATGILNGYPKKHGRSIESLAEEIGYENWKTLQRHINPSDHARPFPLSKLIPLIRACNNDFTVLDHIENSLGRVAIQIKGGNEEISMETVGKLAKEAGEAIAAIAGTLDGSATTQAKKQACVKELLDLVQVCHGLLFKLNEQEQS
jgi:hypothetical protein